MPYPEILPDWMQAPPRPAQQPAPRPAHGLPHGAREILPPPGDEGGFASPEMLAALQRYLSGAEYLGPEAQAAVQGAQADPALLAAAIRGRRSPSTKPMLTGAGS